MRLIFKKHIPISAKIRFETGPARATSAMPRLGLEKLFAFTGTGYAHPNPQNKIAAVPTGSRWRRGFKDNLPSRLAVLSPSKFAEYPWANSWTGKLTKIAKIRAMYSMT